jgi:Ankyrin repeats (many copies)
MLSEIMDEEQDDVEDDAEDDDVPLHWIDCNETDEDLARMQRQIVQNPECLNAKERSHCDATALFRAVSYSHPSCVAFLLQAGADPDLDSPTTSLHISIFGESNTDITKMLLE